MAVRAGYAEPELSARGKAAIEAGFPEFLHWPEDLDPDDFFPTSRVRPGMKGIGRTVFVGLETEDFEFEVLGVEHGAMSSYNIIWTRLHSPRLIESGVVRGMSGSPVYIKDPETGKERLLGAVAYGYMFSKEPVAGITPIEQMLRVYQITDNQPHPQESGAVASNWPAARDAMARREEQQRSFLLTGDSARRMGLPGAEEIPPGGAMILPLTTPLMISSAHPQTLELAQRYFSPRGFQALPVGGGFVSGGAGGASAARANEVIYGARPEIKPGAALGVVLLQGDLNLAAVGTVTFVNGDRLIAFGHPMMGEGEVDFPMTSAVIQGIMPLATAPFKIGEIYEIIGSIRQDRLPAVGGSLSYKTPMMPMRVRLDVPSVGEKREFNYEVLPHRDYGPYLSMLAWFDAVEAVDRFSGPTSIQSEMEIYLAGGRVLRRRDFISADSSSAWVTGYPLMGILSNLFNNPWQAARVDRIEIQAAVTQRNDFGALLDARLDRESYLPGETARLRLWIERWRAARDEILLPFTVPADLPDGDYPLQLADGAARTALEYQLRSWLNRPRSLDQMLDSMSVSFPSNELYLCLMRPSAGVAVENRPLPDLPGSVQSALSQAAPPHQLAPAPAVLVRETRHGFPYEIGGNRTFTLRIDRRLAP